MKKNLLFLWMFLVTLSLFNSCSDDDKNQEWENLPTGPIQNDKVSIDLNGTATSGTVTLKATSNEAAQIQFQNVIPGYSDVTVDVKMEKQPDNSFTFSGTKNIASAPTKAEATPVFLTVTVNGTIAADGKVTVNIATSGLGTYIGTYSGATLKLMYGDSELTGKSVVFDATQPQDASIKLTDVIPGDTVTLLTGIQLNANGFSGSTTTTAAKVDYTGALKDKVLTLNLNVTMNDPQGWAATYGLGEFTTGPLTPGSTRNVPLTSAIYLSWSTSPNTSIGLNNAPTLRGILGGIILPQLIKSITLKPDGNIQAEYSSDSIEFDMNMVLNLNASIIADRVDKKHWQKSPANLAYWYIKDNTLYIKLNIANIIAQATADKGSQIDISGILPLILNGDAASIKKIVSSFIDIKNISDNTINTILEWAKSGIPFNIKTENQHTYIYFDKQELDKLMTPEINGQNSDFIEIMTLLKPFVPTEYAGALNIFNSISTYWPNTTQFDLGLDLVVNN